MDAGSLFLVQIMTKPKEELREEIAREVEDCLQSDCIDSMLGICHDADYKKASEYISMNISKNQNFRELMADEMELDEKKLYGVIEEFKLCGKHGVKANLSDLLLDAKGLIIAKKGEKCL